MASQPNLSDQDFELLSAYLDGELSTTEQAAIEARLRDEPALRHALDELRMLIAAVRDLPTITAPRDFTLTPEMVRQPAPTRIIFFRALRVISAVSSAAAVLLIALGIGLLLMKSPAANTVGRSLSPSAVDDIAILPSDTPAAGNIAALPTQVPTATRTANRQATNNAPPPTAGIVMTAFMPNDFDQADEQTEERGEPAFIPEPSATVGILLEEAEAESVPDQPEMFLGGAADAEVAGEGPPAPAAAPQTAITENDSDGQSLTPSARALAPTSPPAAGLLLVATGTSTPSPTSTFTATPPPTATVTTTAPPMITLTPPSETLASPFSTTDRNTWATIFIVIGIILFIVASVTYIRSRKR